MPVVYFSKKRGLCLVFTLFNDSTNYNKKYLFSIGSLLNVSLEKLKRRKGQKLFSYLFFFSVLVSVMRRLRDPGCSDLSSEHFFIATELVKKTSGVQFVMVIRPSGTQFGL